MTSITSATRNWLHDGVAGWDRFWFTPADPATLSLIRVFAGAMLLYTHLVWSLALEDFFGERAWVSPEAAHRAFTTILQFPIVKQADPYGGRSFVWSYFYWVQGREALWAVHIAALVVFALLTVGLFSRVMSVLAYIAALSYVHRTPGALFGLDQINTMLAMYLMIGPCGACYSVDTWLRRRRTAFQAVPSASVAANVAIRLIQLHMCVIYLFAGFGKLTGGSWWTGMGLWGGLANYEYQSLDGTWLAHWPLLAAFSSHLTVYWEVYYVAAIWPRWTRPIMLAIAIPLHLGIALFMGMITFGLVMLIGNLAFVPPGVLRGFLERNQAARPPQPLTSKLSHPARQARL